MVDLRKLFLFTLLLVFSLAFFSCQRNRRIDFNDGSSGAFSYVPGVRYAVVTEPLAGLRRNAGYENQVLNYARRGDILLVRGKQALPSLSESEDSDEKNSRSRKSEKSIHYIDWYCFDSGWLDEGSLSVFDNRMQAEKFAEKILSVQ